jgi:outer membrane scaffolding protein for murein synthesis (MipA/OmpV family)
MASVEVGAAFADARQLRRDFGVSGAEAARRQTLIDAGDPRLRPNDGLSFTPGGGVRDGGASASLMYFLSPRLALIGLGGVNWLTDEVADSPLVRSREQAWGGLSLMWRR